MTRALQAAVIGVGHLGRHHARILAGMEDVQLVAVVDPAKEQGQKIASNYGCAWYPHRSELQEEVDFVVVATPTVRHLDCAGDFLDRGVACLVEKPLAPDPQTCRAILDRAARGNACLGVGHVERFNPAVRRAMELGIHPRFVEAHRLSPYPFRSTDVGVVLDLMIHDLDLLLAWTANSGQPARIEEVGIDAVGGSVLSRSEDIVSARLKFPSGFTANLTASRLSLKPMRRFRVFGPDCYLSVDSQDRYALLIQRAPGFSLEAAAQAAQSGNPLEAFQGLMHTEELTLDDDEPLRAELEAFAAAVRSDQPAPVTGEDGARAVQLAHRVLTSMQESLWDLES